MLHLEYIEIREKMDQKLIIAKTHSLAHFMYPFFSSNKHTNKKIFINQIAKEQN